MEELTRRTILTLPVLLLGSGEKAKKPYTAPAISDDHEIQPFLAAVLQMDDGPETLTESLRFRHDTVQLGAAPDIRYEAGVVLIRIRQVLQAGKAANRTMPEELYAMEERLQEVMLTGRPVMILSLLNMEDPLSKKLKWVSEPTVHLTSPKVEHLQPRRIATAWVVDIPAGVVTEVKWDWKDEPGISLSHTYEYNRQGECQLIEYEVSCDMGGRIAYNSRGEGLDLVTLVDNA